MKKALLSLLIAILPFQATAADLGPSLKDEVIHDVPASRWSGCYLGANIGAGWQHAATTYVDHEHGPSDNGSHTGSGAVGGGQIGCDLQRGRFVIGVQGMFNAAGIDGSNTVPDFPENTVTSDANWFASVTGRLGVTLRPDTLLYAKGGVAWTDNDFSDVCYAGGTQCDTDNNGNFAAFGSNTATGWIVGGGIEHAWTDSWSMFIEYNYVNFGNDRTTLTDTLAGFDDEPTWQSSHDLEQHLLLVGLNYKFR
ncbi:MAG: hypothetical protein B7Y80_19185 [Hyphomicrobium sp. 32-62-53]|nr:MAG: hypothetical protein B7Z29_18015 [Hyphomicrobium sp. 12-62-95]OYX97547.1 MAG: hypothetical protein B7Y80_19185 [Hyphomicrobium sp. 32-62-53]